MNYRIKDAAGGTAVVKLWARTAQGMTKVLAREIWTETDAGPALGHPAAATQLEGGHTLA